MKFKYNYNLPIYKLYNEDFHRSRYGNNNEVLYGHTGGSVGGTTYAFIAIDYNVIVVITSNLIDASFGNLPNDIFEIYN